MADTSQGKTGAGTSGKPHTAQQNAVDDSKCTNIFRTTINYALQKDRNSVCAPDTGLWFFHHPEYEAFQRAKRPQLLFVTAEAGGGKSTTMRTLIESLKESKEPPLMAYFFFKDDDDGLRSYDEAMVALIHQLLAQEPGLVQHAREQYREHGDAIKHQTMAMWKILQAMASKTKRDVACVFDAVDECTPTGTRQLTMDLADVFQDTAISISRLRCVVSSRPYQDENSSFAGLVASSNVKHLVGENARVQADIRKVIRVKARELAEKRMLDQRIQDMLVESLCAQNVHTRSFLAVHVAFDLLDSHHLMQGGAEAEEHAISAILAEIPHQLSDQFDEMLRRSTNKEHAWKMFCVILAARRTLKISEFKVIYSLTQPAIGPVHSFDELELPSDDEEFKKLVRSRCGLFITFGKNSVHLFHQTAREHLMAKIEGSGTKSTAESAQNSDDGGEIAVPKLESSWRGSISAAKANLVLATVCLDLITIPVSRTWVLEVFDILNAGNGMYDELEPFLSQRPFFPYAAYNWHEHVVLGGNEALKILCSPRYGPVLDISNTAFWAWFLPLAEYINTSRHQPKAVISSIWDTDEKSRRLRHDYGSFLRDGCIKKLFHMGGKVRALFDDVSPNEATHVDGPQWQAKDGYHLVDSFHQAYGEYNQTSANKAVGAMNRGDEELASILSADAPTPVLIWTCITDGASQALRTTLASVKDLNWLQETPEHIMYVRRKWSGWSSRTGKNLRESRSKGWTKPWPSTFVTISRASALPEHDDLFAAMADWIDESPFSKEYTQQIWEAGGFIVPSLCRRLIEAGASIHVKLWSDRRTAIQIAAAFWEHDLIQTLLELGADPAGCSDNGYTALHWFFHSEKPFDDGSPTGMSSVKAQQLYRKSRITASVKAFARSMASQGSALDAPCRNGKTALMLAVKESPTATKALLEAGAEPDKRDDRGRTAVMHFFRGGLNGRPISILEQLLHAGADSSASDSSGRTVLGYWAQRVTGVSLSNIYPRSNSYNTAFNILYSLGALSQRDLMVKELASLDVPLTVAARLGNARLCWALLDTGTSPDNHGIGPESPLGINNGSVAGDMEDLAWKPLMVALWSKVYGTAAILLHYGADVGFQLPGRKRTKYNKFRRQKAGITPLHLAVNTTPWTCGDIGLSTGGLSSGCGFRAAARPLHPVAKRSPWERLAELDRNLKAQHKAREDNSSDMQPEFETKRTVFANDSSGADSVPFDTLFGSSFSPEKPCDPLLEAVITRNQEISGRQEGLVEHMLRSGASVNARSEEGITPLLASVVAGQLNLAKLLLQHGADPNIATTGGCTSLMVAARNDRRDLVEALLSSGANPDAQLNSVDPEACDCGEFISWSHYTHNRCYAPLSALALAAERGNRVAVEALLEHGADPNLGIVHHAHGRVPSRRERRAREKSGRETDAPSSSDEEPEDERWVGYVSVGTALTWARGEVRELLLRHGADPEREEAMQECECAVIERKQSKGGIFSESEEEYSADEESESGGWPWQRSRAQRTTRRVNSNSS
ncbi:ankyrin repeat-containing protein [Colletotrichum musicola]|uniref:Ankyrin repeat-containing protein n=1 Tax=Colletotrichum musicola TaxID=2175873 RepID=A0A8H6NP83_9PEZI|nr:ankyrin repeat-containing protein [Colletotrichum musicola]